LTHPNPGFAPLGGKDFNFYESPPVKKN